MNQRNVRLYNDSQRLQDDTIHIHSYIFIQDDICQRLDIDDIDVRKRPSSAPATPRGQSPAKARKKS